MQQAPRLLYFGHYSCRILAGVEEKDLLNVKQLLDQFFLFGIYKSTADLAAKLRKAQGWKLPDAFQAAISQENGLKLVTRNTKDFFPQKHTFVSIPDSI
ncbi:MAG: PIN domain-containing protein [Candidatus Riflebacteria bacterium]|nr:PIN domain-containing protein [Candidatus Riflebacteria bacterium]